MAKIIGDGTRVYLQRVRLAFPHFLDISPKTKKYGCALIFPVDSDEAKALDKVARQIAKDKFGARAEKVIAHMKRVDRYPVKDGNTKEDLAGYAGNAYCNANCPTPPTMLLPDRTEMNEKQVKEYLYSGAVVNAIVALYGYDSSKGGIDGVGMALQGIQFVEEGEHFSGGSKAKADEFEELAPVGGAEMDTEDNAENFPF